VPWPYRLGWRTASVLPGHDCRARPLCQQRVARNVLTARVLRPVRQLRLRSCFASFLGAQLRDLRLQRHMSMRDVHAVTERLAKQKHNRKLTITPSRLSDLENEKVTPDVYRLYALSVAYRCPMTRLLKFYGLS
jgi:hypothetical protein